MDIKGIKDFQYSIIIINLEADIFSLMEDSENSKQEVVPSYYIIKFYYGSGALSTTQWSIGHKGAIIITSK